MGAATIMIQGTSSDVGKSVICTALCRIFSDDGYSVVPFKSQNMALNSYVTASGGEIGRAQGVQAEAARVAATTTMNPILLKPKQEMSSEVIVHGKHYKDMSATSYRKDFVLNAIPIVEEAIRHLEGSYDIIIAEGAGSPAEINLKDRDIANMRVAHIADADVFLVADIDRGGVFASIVGTLALLDDDERRRVKGLIINKFRGMYELLENGVKWVEEYTGIPVVGVIPYIDVRIDAEDSLALDSLRLKSPKPNEFEIDVVCIQYPRISNFTDIDPIYEEQDVGIRFVKSVQDLGSPDVIILPGTKNTVEDLKWMKESGFANQVKASIEKGTSVFGICGGYQMLGEKLLDPDGIEGEAGIYSGLSILPIETTFVEGKKTTQTKASVTKAFFNQELTVEGYEIHLGQTTFTKQCDHLLELENGTRDGVTLQDGKVIGTYLHGIFQNREFTRCYFNQVRLRKGLKLLDINVQSDAERREDAYNLLAQHVRKHLNMSYIHSLINEQRSRKNH